MPRNTNNGFLQFKRMANPHKPLKLTANKRVIHLYNSPAYGVCAAHAEPDQLTREHKKVTCKTCKRIMKHFGK
jgi:hypothetical protein